MSEVNGDVDARGRRAGHQGCHWRARGGRHRDRDIIDRIERLKGRLDAHLVLLKRDIRRRRQGCAAVWLGHLDRMHG